MFELVDGSQIHLESGHSAAIVLKFVPLTLRPRHCAIVLKNKCLGDIVLSVYATVKHPKPIIPESRFLHSATVVNSQTRTLHLKTHAGQTINEEIIICRNNAAFENAMLEICKWHMSPLEMKRRNLSKSFKYAILSTAIATLGMDNESKSCKDGLQEGSEKIVFSVEGNDSEHFKFPQEVSLLVKSGGICDNTCVMCVLVKMMCYVISGIAILPIQFHADSGGQYECRLILKSLYDIRVIIIESTVLAMDRHAQIEFETKATVPVTQDIPLVKLLVTVITSV